MDNNPTQQKDFFNILKTLELTDKDFNNSNFVKYQQNCFIYEVIPRAFPRPHVEVSIGFLCEIPISKLDSYTYTALSSICKYPF